MDNAALISALQAELAGYVRRGLKDRAKAVEQELRRLGSSSAVAAVEAVPAEAASTPQNATRSVRKPSKASKPVAGTKTAKKGK